MEQSAPQSKTENYTKSSHASSQQLEQNTNKDVVKYF